MTKHKNIRAKRKASVPAGKRAAGRKFVPKSQPAFKQQPQQQKSQFGGRWSGNNRNNRQQGSYGLSYEYSQRKQTAQATSSFSSFFAPSSRPQQAEVVELGLLIRKHWVGGLIGKKGKTIWAIRDKSNGANIDFGNDDIVIDRSKDTKWDQGPWPAVQQEKYAVCAVSGSKEQAVGAVSAIAEHLAKSAQSSDYMLQFLIPEAYVGSFIGKKGTNLKQMKGPLSDGVSIQIRDEPILLGSNRTTLCTLFGPAKSMLKTIERTARWLGAISIRVQTDRAAGQG